MLATLPPILRLSTIIRPQPRLRQTMISLTAIRSARSGSIKTRALSISALIALMARPCGLSRRLMRRPRPGQGAQCVYGHRHWRRGVPDGRRGRLDLRCGRHIVRRWRCCYGRQFGWWRGGGDWWRGLGDGRWRGRERHRRRFWCGRDRQRGRDCYLGGAAASTNGSGGSVVITGGAATGSGIAGAVRLESLVARSQGAPAAKTFLSH